MMKFDVVIVGAGGAGLFCAAVAGARAKSVAVLDHNDKPGKKILISGGGRCNFTNLGARAETYLSQNPHFAKSALSRYTPQDFLALVERHGIAWHEKKLGQLFCDGSAKEILGMLLAECSAAGAELHLGTSITRVDQTANGFHLATSRGEYDCAKLVLACGGLSIPPIGASDFGYRLAQQFGLEVVRTQAALVPFTLSPQDLLDLAGVAVDADVTCGGTSFSEAILFTHKGLSGPAILQISSYWNAGQPVLIDLLPGDDLARRIRAAKASGAKQTLPNLLAEILPKRLAQAWVTRYRMPEHVHHLTEAEIERLAACVHRWNLLPAGTEGYRTAEVTRGGISTSELSSKTLEAKKVPGLHCIGEVVDVTGWLGGYNFQWAWASAHAAGSAV
jgi:predicted Rossmann fold flavoprotein